MEKMPVLFVGNGSTMNAIEENEFSMEWRKIGQTIPRPDAVLCISANWETQGTMVTAMASPRTIHDFGGFPRALYEVHYPAAGNPELAKEIREMIPEPQIEPDQNWGLDHGCWSVLRHMFPDADVPVVQMSLDYTREPRFHFELGMKLSKLREKGVLIIGSGNMVHNLRMVAWDKLDVPGFGYDWAVRANEKIKTCILEEDVEPLLNYKDQGNDFELAIPTPDHFLPLLYILALKEEGDKVGLFNDKMTGGSLSMTSVRIDSK